MFHPLVQAWFDQSFQAPTPCQTRAWPAISAGQNVLIAAPTGSGKTLAAFLASIDELVKQAVAGGGLPDETAILYVSPLKALSNDIEKNLRAPLEHINRSLLEAGVPQPITAAVRTGDTPSGERAKMVKRPPHILVTTPESLFILLTSLSGRELLSTVTTTIVDEIHALAPNKRGSHLSLSLERLTALTGTSLVRIGLSATQRPLDRVAAFLTGNPEDDHKALLVDEGVHRDRDLEIVLPDSPLEAIMSAEVWGELYTKICELIENHRTTLIFVNTRRHAERIAHKLAERLGEDAVTSHHGSLSKQHRHRAEQRLKSGQLRALVATASLELGIDIGDIDLVCQLGSPRSASVLLQRVGRSGHGIGRTPKGRLFPLSRDDLVECVALLRCSSDGELDELEIPEHPLDVLSQQIVAEVANREWPIGELFKLFTRAQPYHNLSRETFDQSLQMLGEGFSTRRGRRSAHLHLDLVNGRVNGRKGARLTALTNAGAIPDLFDYDVVMEPEGIFVGTLNEDFAFESLAGDIFQLGNTSYRILRVEKGVVRVVDAKGQPPSIPFWFGEAPGRGDSLSRAVSRLRTEIDDWMATGGEQHTRQEAVKRYAINALVAAQLVEYLGAAWRSFGERLPTRENMIAERFFDDAGDMHLVIHSPNGSRLNRAMGLALRKRFCRRFNFELQAAALEDCIVLSLGETHSFDLDEVARYLSSASVRNVLIQALLDAPVFPTHWRWVTNIALAVRRFRNGKKVPAQFQRSEAEDLVAVVFPDQLACLENIKGEREIPDHPLVNQALWDCLHEVMDIDGLEDVLRGLEQGSINWIGRDMVSPSPLAEEVLNAKPYAFLDDAPAEERRTLAIQSRAMPEDRGSDYSRLDPAAIDLICSEAWPQVNSSDELHDALVCGGFIAVDEVESGGHHWHDWFAELVAQNRATKLRINEGPWLWIAAERLREVVILGDVSMTPDIVCVNWQGLQEIDSESALISILRSRLEISGPITLAHLARLTGLPSQDWQRAMRVLEQQGFAMLGGYRIPDEKTEWCDRRLLARIHRYTLKTLRAQIEPVSLSAWMRFLFQWQHIDAGHKVEGEDGAAEVFSQLEGYGAPLKAWEAEILPSRIFGYTPALLDQIGLSGKLRWRKYHGWRSSGNRPGSKGLGQVSLAFYSREDSSLWAMLDSAEESASELSSSARQIAEFLSARNGAYYDDIRDHCHMLPGHLEDALAELIARGMLTCDGFNGFRALLLPQSRRRQPGRSLQRRHRRLTSTRIEQSGRWSLVKEPLASESIQSTWQLDEDLVEMLCDVLLHRYGMICRALCDHEKGMPPWRMLLPHLRRLEDRGVIRGGRFVAKLQGEQFALPEAVEMLRKQRKQTQGDQWVRIASADPLNLTGGILPGQRVGLHQTLLFRNGVLVAHGRDRDIQFVSEFTPQEQWKMREKLHIMSSGSRRSGVTLSH